MFIRLVGQGTARLCIEMDGCTELDIDYACGKKCDLFGREDETYYGKGSWRW